MRGINMIMVMLKSADGTYQPELMEKQELREWFKDHTDDDGNVENEIIVYQGAVLKQVGDEIPWVMSDYSVDRDNERIDPIGWDLRSFKKNPILLWSHDYTRPAIGKVESPRVKDGKLMGKVIFSSGEIDPFAGMIEKKVREGILTSGSVGFVSNKVEMVDDKDEEAYLIHRKQELREFSVVNIPSNINARPETRAAKCYVNALFEEVTDETSPWNHFFNGKTDGYETSTMREFFKSLQKRGE